MKRSQFLRGAGGQCALAALLWLTWVQAVLARAGGGGGFGGGGGGGGGGGDGDAGAILWLLYYLVVLCIKHPVIGIPIVVALVALVIWASRAGRDTYRGGVIREASDVPPAQTAEGLTLLQHRDPAFSAGALAGRVSLAFVRLQESWCAQDLARVRLFISDAVHERFAIQFDEQQALGYRDRMTGLEFLSASVAQVKCEDHFDTVTFRIVASAIDQRVSLRDGRVISGDASAERFVEYWSFIRRIDAVSKAGQKGLMEGNCPNCGAGVGINQVEKCTHCGALLRSGKFDWVLAEITQASAWNPRGEIEPSGVPLMRARDPAFNRVALEDRASVIFWRLAAAERRGVVDPLVPVATADFSAAEAVAIKPPPGGDGGRRYVGDRAVGAVDARGVVFDDDKQRAIVQITWSGTHFYVGRDGALQTLDRATWVRTLLVLCRAVDARTNLEQSISSAHCPGCGAPATGAGGDRCPFCGRPLNDGASQWVLEDAVPLLSDEGSTWLTRLTAQAEPLARADGTPGARSNAELLAWLARLAASDGVIDPREQERLADVAERRGVGADTLHAMLDAAGRGELDTPLPADRAEARRWTEALAQVAIADGRVSREEWLLLRPAAAAADMSMADLRLLLRRTHADAYREARDRLRVKRRGRK